MTTEIKLCPFCGAKCDSSYPHPTKTQDCERCDRIEKWSYHAGATPSMVTRYAKLLAFVKDQSRYADSHITHIRPIGEEAKELLKEIGEL